MKSELYVGSISPKATEEDIKKLFAVAGTVTSVHLIRDNQTGEFKGCGYVRMATAEQAREAIETLDGALLINKVLTVSIARPQPPQKKPPFRGGRRDAGQGGPFARGGKRKP